MLWDLNKKDMEYNFDEIIERRGTNCFKWDFFDDDESVIPMPVADMDFRVAEPIIEALMLATEHGIYGYSICPPALIDLVIDDQFKKYNWKIEKEWLVWLPGLEPAITTACKAFGDKNSSILTPIPVYHPFHFGINHANAQLVTTKIVEEKGRYTFNFDEFERSFESNTRLFLFCNPHNPGGTVFTKEELKKISDLCLINKTIICSDEIHSEILIHPNAEHIPIASLSKEIEQNSITLLSPTKTYNTAAMACSVAVIPNAAIRDKFIKEKAGMMPAISRHAYLAAMAAWQDGEDWKLQLIDYLRINHDYLLEKINKIPGFKMLPLEATYLAWIDCRASSIENIQELLLKNGVRLIDGSLFKGEGFLRLNFACPFSVLKTAVERIEKSVFEYKKTDI